MYTCLHWQFYLDFSNTHLSALIFIPRPSIHTITYGGIYGQTIFTHTYIHWKLYPDCSYIYLLRVRVRLPRVNLPWVDIITWGKVTLCRVARGKFYHGIITPGKDKVTQGEYNLGIYKYPGKVALDRVTRDKLYQGIIIQ